MRAVIPTLLALALWATPAQAQPRLTIERALRPAQEYALNEAIATGLGIPGDTVNVDATLPNRRRCAHDGPRVVVCDYTIKVEAPEVWQRSGQVEVRLVGHRLQVGERTLRRYGALVESSNNRAYRAPRKRGTP